MSDVLTEQLLKIIPELSLKKKRAILELLKQDEEETISLEEWKQQLLKTSIWSEEDLKGISEAREVINSWKPREFF